MYQNSTKLKQYIKILQIPFISPGGNATFFSTNLSVDDYGMHARKNGANNKTIGQLAHKKEVLP